MNIIFKFFGHFHTVNKHRWYVFLYSIRAGIPFRGLVHDLSKYSIQEFFESVKYFDGHRSPIHFAKVDKGYSLAWLHHKGRNKHHVEYWEDVKGGKKFGAFIPYKYVVESVCDRLAACRAYNRDFNYSQPLEYYNRVDKNSETVVHPGVSKFFEVVLTSISSKGICMLNSKYLKKVYSDIYDEYVLKK